MAKFTHAELKHRAMMRVARILYERWEESGTADTRLFEEALVPKEFTHVGTSTKGGEHNEHLVPRALLRDICMKEFDRGRPIEEVAETISSLLKTADITQEEARRLDHELQLRTEMPKGWDWQSGDYMARLRCAGIKLRKE